MITEEDLEWLRKIGATEKEIMYMEISPLIRVMTNSATVRIHIASIGLYVWERVLGNDRL